MNIIETLKYTTSSIWSSWNPINWSLQMKLAALSYILSGLVDGSTAESTEETDIPLTSDEKEKWFDFNDNSDDSFAFRSIKFPPSYYIKHAKEIPVCLKELKILKKLDNGNYVPDEAIASHKFIRNFSNLLKHFKLDLLGEPSDSDPLYFVGWKLEKGLGDVYKIFGNKLERACNNIKHAESYWNDYETREFSNTLNFNKVMSNITHCNNALLGCDSIGTEIYHNNLVE